MKSWVDLSKSNPPTPPHPHQRQQQVSPHDAEPPLGRPLSPIAGPSSSSAEGDLHCGAAGLSSQYHQRSSQPSSPRPVPGAMAAPPIQSSSLRSSPLLQGAASSSLTEQYDSVGPLAAPYRLSQGLILATSKDAPSSSDVLTKESVATWHHGFANGEEYLRLLKEAQKEPSLGNPSNQSSARVSSASSRRDTPKGSPKSPPNSPNPETAGEGCSDLDQLGSVYINYYSKADDSYVRLERNTDTDWIWDWSSRPDQQPPKEWRFSHPGSSSGSSVSGHSATTVSAANFSSSMLVPAGAATPALLKPPRRGASFRRVMVGRSPLFSRDVLYTLLITNVLSLLLGTGLGVWLSRRSGATVTLATLPFN